jgi:hypothetical protein
MFDRSPSHGTLMTGNSHMTIFRIGKSKCKMNSQNAENKLSTAYIVHLPRKYLFCPSRAMPSASSMQKAIAY